MKKWKVELASEGEALGKVKFNGRILEGNSLSSLLFDMTMTPLTVVMRKMKVGS